MLCRYNQIVHAFHGPQWKKLDAFVMTAAVLYQRFLDIESIQQQLCCKRRLDKMLGKPKKAGGDKETYAVESRGFENGDSNLLGRSGQGNDGRRSAGVQYKIRI